MTQTPVANPGDTRTPDMDTLETLRSGWRIPAWRRQSACVGQDPDAYFPENGRPRRELIEACAGCPVRAECLESALESPWMPSGVQAGYFPSELKPMWLERHPRDRANDDSVIAWLGLAG